MQKFTDILERFAKSGWDLIAAPAQAWLDGRPEPDALLAAVRQADIECGACGCEFDPLYKQTIELLTSEQVSETPAIDPEIYELLSHFANSGWDMIAKPAQAWLNGSPEPDKLLAAVRQADVECGVCGCEFDPYYKRAIELLTPAPVKTEPAIAPELRELLANFADSGWDMLALPAQSWLDGNPEPDKLLAAVRQADAECGQCGCAFDPLYKRAIELLSAGPAPHDMRRSNQQLTDSETRAVLRRGTSGTLALICSDGYPYALPLSYLFDEDRIYFHSAVQGHKLDAIRHCDRASFCVIDRDDVQPDTFTTHYRSAIAFGRVRIIESAAEMRPIIDKLAARYSPGIDAESTIADALHRMRIIEFTIERLTGKEAIELVRARTSQE